MTFGDARFSLQGDTLRLGDALREAAAADLARAAETPETPSPSGDPSPRRRTRPRRRIGTRTAVALVAVALAVPAAAIATGVFSSSEQEVADSLVGSIALPGAEPTCTTVREGLEYECLVEKGELINGEKIEPGDWLGAVYGSFDKRTHRTNGGCRSQDAEGTRWLCYLGKEAVRQEILMPMALGQYVGP